MLVFLVNLAIISQKPSSAGSFSQLGSVGAFIPHHTSVVVLFMPPTLKKLEGHIALGLSVCLCVCASVNF